jgi:hypothetical protein
MTPLTDRQKQLLFDFSLGLTTEHETLEAERLLASSDEAAALHHLLRDTLAPLDTLEVEPCPDKLTERLFARAAEMSQERSSRDRLEELLADERSKTRRLKFPVWRNWSEVVTAAAVIVLFLSVLFPSVGFMRQRYWQANCGAQLSSIYGGLRNYVADHDGLLPAVAMVPGSPWWKVGYQGKENHSNTRRAWLLVRGDYVAPNKFLCPARREEHRPDFAGFRIRDFNDFPNPAYIHFSIRIGCPASRERDLTRKCVVMADRNPLSERLPSDYTSPLNLPLVQKLMTSNSKNHAYRGQSVLLYDGSVEFIKERHTSISEDDIYTLQDMCCGSRIRGCELPDSDTDIFLAP